MALRKKQRPAAKRRKQQPVRISAYQRGHIAGFERGKADGFQQGRADALSSNTTAIAERTKADVLVIAAGFIPSLDIGVIQPFNELKNRGNFNFEVMGEDEVSKEMIAAANTVVFVRNVEPAAYTLMELAHQLRKQTVYVIDDNFLEMDPGTPVGLYYCEPERRETFIKFLKNAKTVKVDALELGEYIQKRYNNNVVYFPGSVDFAWIDQQSKDERNDMQVVIGYEGGVKEEDFAPVIPALKKILDYYGGFVRLEFFGFVPASLEGHPSVSYEEGGMDYRSFIRKLKQCTWDIGLAPLHNHSFNNSKTNNKFREYAACQIPGIYSKSPVYTPWVTHGETGYLAPHTEEGWYEGIRKLIEDPEMRHRIKENAEAAARQHFSLDTCVENWNKYIFKP
ncbi:glycosyltransferase [Paenibacillus abyssi]|uniref:Glycosyl transferase family 1 domain-containing protein n=1 Tax=Paenibacillus abyssi TaxID=1340531 RepID=A0A917CV73_9BACL|nr:glycosyltransferase [Paenibacillus abyssi]GGF98683.1 hypothetical protein GCM10010916_14900 [Paenibacillus abyssi]